MSQPASTMPPCENCGGQQVGNLEVTSQQAVGIHPIGRNLWSRPLSPLAAVACLNCGLTKLFAADLEALRKETQKNPQDFTW
ncbi:hypothetical protein GCM10009630_64950 [Kribbella jejuensis]|uniref:Uncharacterized protein n=1 Tax=Kribbella jejuensis TaxID=236068 RepID=A0A542ELZ9_9ACTN|nr:hypothetical protein [Kribbella jejuensis]TQJ16370.1 hypothetical protein FB475_0464 [Kribbella jejuensis]